MITPFAVTLLAVPAAMTTFFSLFNRPHIRGFRNLGIVATYALGIYSVFPAGVSTAVATWGAFGLASGVLYYVYEYWSYSRSEDVDDPPSPRTILYGFIAWPVMLPEVVEYTLAEVGILKSADLPQANGKSDGDPDAT